jgi:hypothetical protein
VVATQGVPHRDRVDVMSQVRQGTLDAAIAPGTVLLRHLNHELFDLLGDPRSATLMSMFAPIELPRN